MKLNLKELNQVTGGMTETEILNKLIEDLRDEVKRGQERLIRINQALCEQHKKNEELKQKILVLETLLKTSQPIVIIN